LLLPGSEALLIEVQILILMLTRKWKLTLTKTMWGRIRVESKRRGV
jgi:hypothetical protein